MYLSNRGTALVLAGGGGKGAYQIGVWKALREYGADRNITGISGTSVGALNMVLFAQGDYGLAENLWKNITSDEILKVDIKKIMLNLITAGIVKNSIYLSILLKSMYGSGMFSREGLIEIIDNNIDLYSIGNSDKNIFAAAYNTKSLSVDYLELNGRCDEDIKKILLATSALPIIFDKEEVDGNTYIDGGVKDNVPIKPLYDMGYRTFIVVHLSRDSIIDREKFEGSNIIEIVPSDSQGDIITGTLDFSREGSDRRIEQGYKDAVKVLKPLYEMGMIQSKISSTLVRMREEEKIFQEEKRKIHRERENLKSELEKLLGKY